MKHRFFSAKAFVRAAALLMAVVMMITAAPTAIALESYRALDTLAEQTFTLVPEDGVTVTLSGLMPSGGYAEVQPAELADDEGVLCAYDITIFYPGGEVFEPADDAPISVCFQSGEIAEAIADDSTALTVTHIADDGEEETVSLLSAEDDEMVFEAESFSVYVIRTHTVLDENKKPRKTFHFLSPNYTLIENTTKGGESEVYYRSEAYYFPNKLNEFVCTQTVTDGESLQEIVLPMNNTNGLFYGWYVVNLKSVTKGATDADEDVYTYYWGSEEPQHIAFNEPIKVDYNEDTDNHDTDVYLAPLFGHYRFLTFHQDVQNSANANTIITRKLITLGEDRSCTLKISDVRAPSTNPNRIVFWGWEYTHRESDSYTAEDGGKTEIVRTVDADDSEIEASITIQDTTLVTPGSDGNIDVKQLIFDIWPVFKEARWVYFNVGDGTGASYTAPQFIMLNDPPETFANVPTREGYRFEGWYYHKEDGTNVRVTDENAKIVDKVEELAAGVSIRDGRLVMTNEADEQTLYASWIPATDAVYHVIVWKQKITDDKDASDHDKTYDFEDYYEIEGNTTLDATETHAFRNGSFTDMSARSGKAAEFIGFHYNDDLTTVTDNGYGSVGSKVNPNGSTVVNIYYDRDLMTATYHYNSSSGYTTTGGNAYIETDSEEGELYGKVGGSFIRLTRDIIEEGSYLFPYNYAASDAEDDRMYGLVTNAQGQKEYVEISKVLDYNEYVYNYKSGYQYTVYNGTPSNGNGDYFGIYNSKPITVYYNKSKWYRTKGWFGINYSDPYYGTRYSRGTNDSAASYTGARYVIGTGDFVATDNTTGDLYGYRNGTYIPLSYTVIPHYKYTYNGIDYTGQRFTRTGGNSAVYKGDVCQRTESGFVVTDDYSGTLYAERNGAFEVVNRYNEETVEWSTSDGAVYTGQRYLLLTPSGDNTYPYVAVLQGLYGQTYAQYGYSWPSHCLWNESSDGKGINQSMLTGFTTLLGNTPRSDYHLYCQGKSSGGTLYHLRQKLDGTYSQASEYYDIAHIPEGTYSFTFTNKFSGYNVCGYSTSFAEDGKGVTPVVHDQVVENMTFTNQTVLYVYHSRETNVKLTFNDNYNGHTYDINGLKFEQPLDSYADAYMPAAREHYNFTGWYEDSSCTKKFNFNSVMPNGNKIVYAGWSKVRFRVTVDPDGGEFPLGGNFSTYFKIDYGEPIAAYDSTKRSYVEDPYGEYLYVYVSYDKVRNMKNKDTGAPLDLDAAYRKAFYIKSGEIKETYDKVFTVVENGETVQKSFADSGMSIEDFSSCIDMSRRYSHITGGSVEYRLVSWHKVRSDDPTQLEQTPFNFSSVVDEDTNLRARWMRVGKYSLAYDPTMTGTGVTGDMSRYNDPLESDRKFSDQSPVIILQAPTNLKIVSYDISDHETVSSAEEYIFRGWRIVDGETHQPLETDKFYDPGDTYYLDARMADKAGVIHMEAYYEKKESTVRRVDVTSLTLDANGGEVNTRELKGDKYEYADLTQKQLRLERQSNNFSADLSGYIKNFSHKDGDFLLGWDTEQARGDYIPEYYADSFIGVNKNNTPPSNTLYAVWEPMVYLTLQNKTTAPVSFELKFTYNGTVYAGHTNEMTDLYERKAFSDETDIVEKVGTGDFKVTLPVGANIRLVLPEGEGADYVLTGSFDGSNNRDFIVYNSGAPENENNTTIKKVNSKWYLNGSGSALSLPYAYSATGTLVKGTQGRLIMFSETDPETKINLRSRYYEPDGDDPGWKDETSSTVTGAAASFILPAGAQASADGDGYTTTVKLINNNKTTTFGLNVTDYDHENYKFIGWYTTPEAAPNAFSVDGKASDFGAERVEGLAVPPDETTYYALFVPYVAGRLTIVHNEKDSTAGHCAEGNGLKLDIEYYDTAKTDSKAEWHAVGDWTEENTASCTLTPDYIYEKNTTGRFRVTVSAKPHSGSVYKTTYRNQFEIDPADITQGGEGAYSTAVFDAPVSERFADSETVKGLKELRTISYSSVFTRGYTVTYTYTARDGEKKDYILTGSADSFDDFTTFVIEHAPYERSLTGAVIWDIQNIETKIDDFGMKAVMKEKSTFREKRKVTMKMGNQYEPYVLVEYGETFTDEQAEANLPPAEKDGRPFICWDIVNADTGMHIAYCYSPKFTFSVWNNYILTPCYEGDLIDEASQTPVPATKQDEGQLVTVDYIETSRNQWGGAVHSDDDTTTAGEDFTDKMVVDMDVTFIDGDRMINENPDGYQLGVFFEICGATEDGTFDEMALTPADPNIAKQRVRDIIVKPKPSNSATDTHYGSKGGYYYSRIDVASGAASNFNRVWFARTFTTSAVKNRVFRVYAYMVTPEDDIILSAPQYLTLYEYASLERAILD